MAASVWRMNGLWRRTAGVLVLCILLLSNMVTCQVTTDSTDQPATQSADPAAADPTTDVSAVTPPEAQGTTATLDVGDTATAGAGDKSAPFEDPGDASFQLTVQNVVDSDSQAGETSGTSGTTAAPVARVSMVPVVTEVPDDESLHLKMVPAVQCVGKEDIPESNAVRAVVETDNCEATKRIIQENPAIWCHSERCNLDVFQDGNKVMLTSKDVGVGSLAATLQSEHLKDKLGVTMTETPASSGSSVFFGILVSGLLAALGIIVGYCKCQRRPDPKGVRLAEEAYPVDPENQANTLVSVAPLNPPSETQEKPSVNGESPEAAKTQPTPPTNGHSTAKTADTEL